MNVDRSIEPLVRDAFAAAVAQEPARLTAALDALRSAGPEAAGHGVLLALAVNTYALLESQDGAPGELEIEALADSICEMEAWADLERSKVVAYLQALAEPRDPSDTMAAPDLVRSTFVIGAWLLAALPPEGAAWTDYLDDVLDGIEGTVEKFPLLP